MLKQLFIASQQTKEGLIPSRAGAQYLLPFPSPVSERPYLGQLFELKALALTLVHTIQLKIGQSEAFTSSLDVNFRLIKNGEIIGVFPLSLQMRQVPGSEGKTWIGEAPVYADFNNPVPYGPSDTLTFAVSGVVPGVIAGPTPLQPLITEGVNETEIRNAVENTQFTVEQILATANELGSEATLEEILSRLEEME